MKFVGWSARQSGRFLVGQAGLSILEVLVSAFIVGIAAVGLALMFSSGQAFVQAEGDNRVALFLAEQRIEQIRAVGFAGATVTNVADGAVPQVAGDDPSASVENPICNAVSPCPPSPHPGYIRKTSIVCVSPTDFSDRILCPNPQEAKLITVTVETSPVDPKARPVTLQTVLAEH